MMIKQYLFRFLVLLGISFCITNSYAEKNQIVMQGTYNSVNIQAGYIVANDMKFSVDNATRVYDSSGQLRSLKSLKPGQQLNMHYRNYGRPVKNVSEMVLDKIIYYSK
ncbi:MAG: hypothetical protein COB26_12160 [Piscirickettsiaceae bacterium]|nr:MAG: hypothetical protein COB89_07920 [Piscirickettsiaceae bacterium]PCI65797.1 MAG: hypothetical protein COB26_12160 [Piscirickettsiaceae bacterium]